MSLIPSEAVLAKLRRETEARKAGLAEVVAKIPDVSPLEERIVSLRKEAKVFNEKFAATEETLGALSTKIEDVNRLIVSETAALSERIANLSASVDDGALARVVSLEQAFATAQNSAAISERKITAKLNDAEVSITQEAAVRAEADGQIHARWGVSIDGSGRIIGRINLNGTNASSAFEVAADKFVVTSPDGSVTAMDVRPGGKIVFGNDIQSDNYDGSNGWRLTRTGDFTANSGTFRGNVVAATISGGTISIDDDGAVRIARCTFQNQLAPGGTHRQIGLELGYFPDGLETETWVDFRAVPGADFNARIYREKGTNGVFDIIQTGSGDLRLVTGTGLVQFGTFVPDSGATPTGYIQIKDSTGTVRLLLCA